MANDTGAVPAVPLFQRAHARMVLLQKIDRIQIIGFTTFGLRRGLSLAGFALG